MGMTVIDALVVTLGLDASQYVKGQKAAAVALDKTDKAATKTAKDIEAQGKRAAQSFTAIRNEVLGLAAAFIGLRALKTFANDVTRGDAAVGRLAVNTGMVTTELAAWEGIASRAGGSAEGMAGSVKGLTSQLQKLAITGNSDIIPFLTAAHVNLSAFFDAATPMGDRLLMIADAFAGISPAKAQALGAGMGLDEGTVNLLLQGRGAINDLLAKQRAMNAASAEDARLAIERQRAWDDVKDSATGVGRVFLEDVTPAILTVYHAMRGLLSFAKEHMALAEATAIGLASAIGVLGALKMAGLLSSIAALNTGLAGVAATGALVFGVLAKLGLVGVAGAAGYAIGSLISMGLNGIVSAATGRDETLGGWLADATGARAGGSASGRGARGAAGSSRGAAGASAFAALIARGEGDYNSVNRGARGGYASGTENLEAMTISEVMAAQKAGRFNAAGRYQMIGSTLSDGVQALGLGGGEKFDRATQDRLFNEYLVGIKRKAIGDYINGKSNNLGAALHAAAREWASVADPNTGRSYYEGIGNNHASITVAETARALQASRDAVRGGSTSTSDTQIGQIVVQTQATDAQGIARSIAPALREYAFVASANSGLD